MIAGIRDRFRHFLLKRKLDKLNREVKSENLQNLKEVALLFDASKEEEFKLIRQFMADLKASGAEVKALGFVNAKEANWTDAADEMQFFNKQELNLFRIPVSRVVHKFIHQPFDLLIDLNGRQLFPLQYVSSLSKATFKVGPAAGYQSDVCDMTIAVPYEQLTELCQQILHYLNLINPPTDES